MIKILLVDDQQLVRFGLKGLLERTTDIEVIGDVASGEEAVEFVKTHETDVVLMDLRMPGIGGLEATRRVARASPKTRVLVATVHIQDPYPKSLFKVGAAGFLSKAASEEELIRAIHAVHAGERYISPDVAEMLNLKTLNAKEPTPFSKLAERELQVVLMLLTGKKINYLAKQLHVSSKTVCTYRYRIYDKLGVETDVGLTLLAFRHGLLEDMGTVD